MSLNANELKIVEEIDRHSEEIIELGRQIAATPELGYREIKTSELMRNKFERLSLKPQTGCAVTGVKATIGNKENFNVCLIGELDAVVCFGRGDSDSITGAAHACGHNAQLAALYGAACGIVNSGVMDNIDGAVTFFAVPAEEYIDLDYRRSLKEQGKIRFFGGKQQIIYEGGFDDAEVFLLPKTM